jgi:ATP-dependent DNA helicase PIF1
VQWNSLVVRAVDKHIIDADIVNVTHAEDRVFIPRILMSPSEDLSLPFKFKWKLFQVRLSFAVTINKAQGHTLPTIGVYLSELVFSHGQLYVAYRGVCLEAPPGFYVKPVRKLIPNAIALGILCILTFLGLDAFFYYL